MSGHYDSDVSDSDRPSKRKQRQIDLKAAKAGGGTVCPVVPSLITDQVVNESPVVTAGWEHFNQPPITSAEKVMHCRTCGFTPDFCEFSATWDSCRESALSPEYRHFYSHYLIANGLPVEPSQAVPESQAKKVDTPLLVAVVKPKKGKKAVVQQITIQRVSRAKHKMATVIVGLDLFDIKLDAAAKIFKKRFACGSSAVKGLPGQQDHVEIQGDCEEIIDVILHNFPQIPENAFCHLKPK